jgi:hypothetical protein
MSVTTPLVSPPVPPPSTNNAPKTAPLDKTSHAAVTYLLTRDDDAWEHLIAILLRARGGLFIVESGSSNANATQRFLELWLAEKLAPYYNMQPEVIQAAAERNEFRYLGKRARNALIDQIRRRKRDALDQRRSQGEYWEGALPKLISLDAAIASTDDNEDLSLDDFLATDQGLVSALGKRRRLEREELENTLGELQDGLKALLGEELHSVLVTISQLFPSEKKGDVARSVARSRGVSVQMARRWLVKLQAVMSAALKAGSPSAKELFALLRPPGGEATFWMPAQRADKPGAE